MNSLFCALLAAIAISAISLVGIFILGARREKLQKVLFYLVSFSAGTLMGGAFFHLLPESVEESEPLKVFQSAMLGFITFFLLERLLRWHHCHKFDCDNHQVLGYQNLFGDGIHNFIDGMIIISAFSVSPALGVAVTVSVALHEIPQEIGDFGVLLYAGFSKGRAVFFNLIAALTAVWGVLVGYWLIGRSENMLAFLLPFAAGGFIYIAASDLIPELHREKNNRKAMTAFVIFLLALAIMFLLVE